MNQELKMGMRDSIPIVLGYFSVSFTFGIMAAAEGLSPWLAGLISVSNVTSAGQFAGLKMMMAHASCLEIILTQVVINLRYALMSLSLSQKIASETSTGKRMLMAFGNTDEVFAVSILHRGDVPPIYMAGLEIPPILAWTAGTVAGAIANNLLPASIQSALGVALYGMFIAIIMTPIRRHRSIAVVATIAAVISCMIYYIPLFRHVSSGFSIIICTVIAATIGAILFPVQETQNG